MMLLTRSMDRPAADRHWWSRRPSSPYTSPCSTAGQRGQTLGKMVWDIRVRDAATGGPLGPAKAAGRYLVPPSLDS